MTKRILIFAISILIISCSQTSKEKIDKIYRNEDELLNQLFWELIIPVPPCNHTDSTMEGSEIYWTYYYAMLKSKQHQILVNSYLNKPKISDYKEIDISEDFKQLYTSLFNDSIFEKRKFIPNPRKIVFDLELTTEFDVDTVRPERFQSHDLLGLFGFSRISFNRIFSKACFLLSVVQNEECSQLFVFFAEKQNDIWKAQKKGIRLN
jgi:hypothetical protein